MGLKLIFLAGAAACLPVAAAAQDAPQTAPDTQPPATTTTNTQQPDANAQSSTSTQADANAQAGSLKPVKEADVKAGASVYDTKGGTVGKVESVSAKGVVVSTGSARATIPLSSFGMGDKGLVIAMTRAELDAQAKAKAKPAEEAKTKAKTEEKKPPK